MTDERIHLDPNCLRDKTIEMLENREKFLEKEVERLQKELETLEKEES